MERLLIAFVTGLKMALLAQAPILVMSLVVGLTWGGYKLEPGFEAVGIWLGWFGLIFGPPLGLVGFVVGVVPGASACE